MSARNLDEAPEWKLMEPPAVVVPDSVFAPDGNGSQRYVAGAVVLADERVVLLTDPRGPESILLRIFDRVTGEDTRVRAPVEANGEPLVWADITMAPYDDGIVLIGSRQADDLRRGRTEGVWLATGDGGFNQPPSHVETVGPLLGAFSDGSLVVSSGRRTRVTDTTLISSFLLVNPVPVDKSLTQADSPRPIFEIAVARDPTADYPTNTFWAHHPRWATGVAEDIIWTIPTERPELVGVDRSGQVLLKVEWDAGDRTIPADVSDEVKEWLRGLKRFPAAKRLFVGTHGLIHVQRVAWRDGRPRVGPEWLVFSTAGELVARLDIPRNLEVMAFGPSSVVTRAQDEDGLVEIRVYTLKKPAEE